MPEAIVVESASIVLTHSTFCFCSSAVRRTKARAALRTAAAQESLSSPTIVRLLQLKLYRLPTCAIRSLPLCAGCGGVRITDFWRQGRSRNLRGPGLKAVARTANHSVFYDEHAV